MNEEEKEAIQILKDWLCKTYSEFCKVGAIGIPNKEFFATETVLNLIGKQNSVLNKIKQLTKVIICDENGKLQKMIYADELYETFRELEVDLGGDYE